MSLFLVKFNDIFSFFKGQFHFKQFMLDVVNLLMLKCMLSAVMAAVILILESSLRQKIAQLKQFQRSLKLSRIDLDLKP